MNPLPTLLADGIFGTGTLAAALLIAALPAAFASPLLYAIFNKAKTARTKGYSSRAVQSVGVWLIALTLTAAAAILALFGWYGEEDVNNYRLLAALVGAGAWSTAVIGIVISLQGLRETDRKFGKNRRRGRSYAVSGCSANGALLLLLLAGGGYYASRIMPRAGSSAAAGPSLEAAAIFAKAAAAAEEALLDAPESPVGMPVAPSVAPQTTATGTAAATSGPPQLAVSTGGAPRGRAWFGEIFGSRATDVVRDPGPEAVEIPALNLRVRRPGGDWVRLDPTRAGQNAVVAYDDPKHSRRYLIVVERPGVERGSDVKALAEQLQKNLQKIVPSFQFAPAESQTYHGVPGLSFLGNGTQQGEPAAVAAWVALYNGYAYQLIVVAAAHQTAAFANDARSLFQSFEPIDAAAVAHTNETAVPTVEWKSPELGVAVAPLGSAWNIWPESAQYFPTADYAARFDGQTGFVLYAVRTDDATVDRLAATSALLHLAGQTYDKAVAQPPKKRTQSKIDGDEYEWTPADSKLGGHRLARIFTVPRAAYLLLGWCDTAGSPKDEALRRALDAVTLTPPPATDPTKLAPGRRTASARFYESVGRYFLEQSQPATAEREFRTAQKFGPDDLSILAAIVDVCFQRGRYPEALAALDAKPALTNRSDLLRIRKAEALAEMGRRDDALKQYAAIFKDGYVDDAAFAGYVAQFEAAGKIDDGLVAVNAYRQRRNTPSVTALEGRLLSRRGDNLAAAKLLERQMNATPAEPDPAFVLADVYRRLQRPLDALQVIDKLIGAGGASGTAYYWKGMAEYDLRRTRPAQLSFASAHRLDPTHVAAKQMLDLTTGLLGELQSYQQRTVIEAVPLPKSVSDAVPASPMPDEYARAAAFYLDRVTAYSYRPGADFRRTEYHTFRVLNEQGVDDLNVLSIQYDPLSEEAYVNRLEVFDDKGRSTTVGDPASYYTIDDASNGPSLRERRLEMPVPGLRAGYRVELVVSVRSLVGKPRFPFFAQIFGGRYPMRRQAVFLDADAQQLAWSGSLAESVRREAGGVWWQATDLPAEVQESFAPPATEIAPTLYVADKRSTWQQEVNEYVAEISERRTVPPIVQQTALEMTAGLDTIEAKLLAISAFVQREIAFRDAPLGPRNRVPQSPDVTLNNRLGDSKDISLLLAMMLATVQIDTRIALVSTVEPVQPNLPTLDQFDHMVVFIGKGDSGRVIDACDKDADARLSVPLRLAGRDCLVVDEKNARLVRLDRPTADSYRAAIQRKVSFDAGGKAKVVETVTFHDYYAAAMRAQLRSISPHRRAGYWQTLLREGGTVAVLNKWQVDRLDDLKDPLVVTSEYEIDRGVIPVGEGAQQQWVGNMPAPFEATQLAIGADESRRYPIEFPFAIRISASTEVAPPPGSPVPDAAGLDAQANDDLLQVKRTVRAEQGVLKLQTELVRTAGRYPPNRYEDYRRSVRRARTVTAPTLHFAPSGS